MRILVLILFIPFLAHAQNSTSKSLAKDSTALETLTDEETVMEVALDVPYLEVDTAKVYMVVDQQPEFPGGYDAMKAFITKNLNYPTRAKKADVKGTVYITFIINKKGRISDVKTLRGIHPDCDKEAERVVNSMPNWTPGKQNDQPVHVRFNLPIRFGKD